MNVRVQCKIFTELLFFHWWVLSMSIKPPCNTIWARYLLNGEIRMQLRGYSNDRHLLNRHTTPELPHATPCMNSDSYFAGKLVLSSPNKRETIAKKKNSSFSIICRTELVDEKPNFVLVKTGLRQCQACPSVSSLPYSHQNGLWTGNFCKNFVMLSRCWNLLIAD